MSNKKTNLWGQQWRELQFSRCHQCIWARWPSPGPAGCPYAAPPADQQCLQAGQIPDKLKTSRIFVFQHLARHTGSMVPSESIQYRQSAWQRMLSGVHSITMEILAQAGESVRCMPTPFHYIYHHVESCSVRSSCEGIYTLYPICTLCGYNKL